MIRSVDACGAETRYEFDSEGRTTAVVDALGRRHESRYDVAGREVESIDPMGHSIKRTYDACGRVVSLTDGAGRVWRWEYDNLGRVTAESDPLGNRVTYAYNALGQPVKRGNARGQETTLGYDVMHRLARVEYPDGTVASFAYDLLGRETGRFGPSGSVTKTYDKVGNLTSETLLPWNKTWQYAYDLVGNRIAATGPEGERYRFSYDALNRVVEADFGNGDLVKYTYDPVGRVTAKVRPGSESKFEFDLAGRLLRLQHKKDNGPWSQRLVASRRYQHDVVGNVMTMVDELGKNTTYEYDLNDWLTRVVYPDGTRTSYSYNGSGDRLSEVVEKPTVIRGRVATETNSILYSYDAGGRMVGKASDTFEYDLDGNLIRALESARETAFNWSADNRLIRVAKNKGCAKHNRAKCGACKPAYEVEEYGYLPEEWRRITRTVYEDDRRTCKHGRGYGHGHGHDCGEIPGHGRGHDRDDDDRDDESVYVSVYDNQDESHEYLLRPAKSNGYDKRDGHGFGHDKHGKCSKHERCSCPPQQNQDSLELVRSFIGGPGVDDLEYTRYHGRNLWHLKDMLGSTIGLTNNSGRTVGRIGYDAWGNLDFPDKPGHGVPPCKSSDINDLFDRYEHGRSFGQGIDPWHFGRHFNAEVSPYLYAGRRLDAFSNNYFNRNRYYKPAVGRFISKDPIGFGGGNNLWGYGDGNPITRHDPTGLSDVFYVSDESHNQAIYHAEKFRYGENLNPPIVIQQWDITSKRKLASLLIDYSRLEPIRFFFYLGHGNATTLLTNALFNHTWDPLEPECLDLARPVFRQEGRAIIFSCFSAGTRTQTIGVARNFALWSGIETVGVVGAAGSVNGWVVESLGGPWVNPSSLDLFSYTHYWWSKGIMRWAKYGLWRRVWDKHGVQVGGL